MSTVVLRTVLVLMLTTAASWAQQTPDSSVSTAEEQASAADRPVLVGVDSEVNRQAEVTEVDSAANRKAEVTVVDSEADPQPEETASETSISRPEEYRASEQISEDLPVSFPVDI